GGCERAFVPQRPLSEIELRLAARVAQLLVSRLRAAWAQTSEVDISLAGAQSDPRTIVAVKPAQEVIRVSFELTVGCAQGAVNLVMPVFTLARIGAQLLGGSTPSGQAPPSDSHVAPSDRAESSVEIVACLAQTQIAAADL